MDRGKAITDEHLKTSLTTYINHRIQEGKNKFPGFAKDISDGYHTFGDLYEHRMAFTAALCQMITLYEEANANLYHEYGNGEIYNSKLYCYKSKNHHPDDNEMFEGMFIVMIHTPHGQISYHYNLEHWDKFDIEEQEYPEKWDKHTPQDTIERLLKL